MRCGGPLEGLLAQTKRLGRLRGLRIAECGVWKMRSVENAERVHSHIYIIFYITLFTIHYLHYVLFTSFTFYLISSLSLRLAHREGRVPATSARV